MKLPSTTWMAFLILILCGCSPSEPISQAQDGRLQVVVTHSILADLVQNVSGDAIGMQILVSADGDAHTYEPSPSDLVKVSEADLIIENGLGFEPWLDNLYASSASQAQRIIATETVEPLTFDEHEGEDHEEEHEGEHGEHDPHVWHDVANAIAMTETIRDALIEADPASADAYRANADAYLAELQMLDEWVRDQVQTLPEDHRRLVTNHDTFGYFAHAYGFEIVGTALGASTSETEPSAGEMAALITEIRDAGVPAIFAENVSNRDLIEQIADEAGVNLAPPLYTDALGAIGTDGETYLKLMRYNVETIVSALK